MARKKILNPEFVSYKQDKLLPTTLIGKVAGKSLFFGGNVDLTDEFASKQDALTPTTVLARINGTPLRFGASVNFEFGGGGGASTTHLYRGVNLFDKDACVTGYSISSANGNLAKSNDYTASDYIPVKGGTYYSFKKKSVVAWYDAEMTYISGRSSGDALELSPEGAVYMRFAFYHPTNLPEKMSCNEGEYVKAWEPFVGFIEIKPDLLQRYSMKKFGLEITTIKLPSEGIAETMNLCLISTRCIRSEGQIPNYTGYLYLDIATQKLYYSSNTPDNPKYLCDWNISIAGGYTCENFHAVITADGDIIFLRNWIRQDPIVYPHEDYGSPFVVAFGESKKPYGFLMGSSAVAFDDGSVVWGEYTTHKEKDEINNDGRCLWHLSKPYSDISKWEIRHTFKHVFFSSPQSDEPLNEIGHVHAVNYDWHKNVLYATTGDIDRHCRLWYSLDRGMTWQAVPGAVGATEGEGIGIGQRWRFTNMIFLEDYIYWCTDSFDELHTLQRVSRGDNGVVDATTITQVAFLESDMPRGMTQATYATAYIREPNGLLILDRAEPRTDGILDVKFWSFEDNQMYIIKHIKRAKTDASSLDTVERIGLPNQTTMQCEPQTGNFIMCGGGTVVRPHNTELFNNSRSNYVGALKLKVVKL